MNWRGPIFIGLMLVGLFQAWSHREISRPPGILVPSQPEQGPLLKDAKPILLKDVVIDPLARYVLRARVLSTERYWADPVSDIAPLDLAVAWGPASDSAVIDQFKIRQSNRFYFYSWSGQLTVDPKILSLNSANVHIIPQNEYIKAQAFKIRPGHLVELAGYLVRVNRKDGSDWVSSTMREDTGNGACEIMLVQSIKIQE